MQLPREIQGSVFLRFSHEISILQRIMFVFHHLSLEMRGLLFLWLTNKLIIGLPHVLKIQLRLEQPSEIAVGFSEGLEMQFLNPLASLVRSVLVTYCPRHTDPNQTCLSRQAQVQRVKFTLTGHNLYGVEQEKVNKQYFERRNHLLSSRVPSSKRQTKGIFFPK